MLLTARQAADRLGIKLETLYAYVSRGRLRSVAVPGSRERHYRSEDVEAFRGGRGVAAAGEPAATVLLPVIDSAICLIEDGRLYYRGNDTLRLSDSASLEDVAALLWDADIDGVALQSFVSRKMTGPRVRAEVGGEGLGLIERCQSRLARLAAADAAVADLSRARLVNAGPRIVAELAASIAAAPASERLVHRQLAAHWRLDAGGADIVRRCLVLLADHELNASTFVARCVASTGATPYAVVSAALAALSGPRHGGATMRAEAFFHHLDAGDRMAAAAERLSHGEAVPGIGHPLYPEGDPRAVAILYAVSAIDPQARRLVNWRPNVDFALAAATTALGLPLGAALGIFVVGRAVGWIAHAIEQCESGVLIRPRARYTGIPPAGQP